MLCWGSIRVSVSAFIKDKFTHQFSWGHLCRTVILSVRVVHQFEFAILMIVWIKKVIRAECLIISIWYWVEVCFPLTRVPPADLNLLPAVEMEAQSVAQQEGHSIWLGNKTGTYFILLQWREQSYDFKVWMEPRRFFQLSKNRSFILLFNKTLSKISSQSW